MNVDDVLKKYSQKIEQEIHTDAVSKDFSSGGSLEYSRFKEELMPALSRYEQMAKTIGGMIRFRLAPKDEARIRTYLEVAHLTITPSEVVGYAAMSAFILFFVGILASVAYWFLQGAALGDFPLFFLFLTFLFSGFLFYYLYSAPARFATRWKLKASSQMVPAVLYTVIYMKHTSNLERAISFVAQHLEAPLSLDFRKIIWDVETGRFSSIKDSLDNYLEFWKEGSIEFVESFHLIESSLYEPNEARRIQILERALKVILDGVYERMLQYTHTIKAPLSNIYMLGIVLPTLGLALLPLASVLLGGSIRSYHIFVFFNIIIPFFVFYLTSQVLLKRPGGYGDTSLLEKNPFYHEYESRKPYLVAFLICFPLFLLGILPLVFGYTTLPTLIGLPQDFNLSDFGLAIFGDKAFDFSVSSEGVIGPFGFFALILSLCVPLSISLFFVIAFSMRTKNLIIARSETEALEKEFTS